MSPSINLTDDQLKALLEQATRVDDPNDRQPAAAPVKFRLGNQEFTAATPEEMQAQIDAAMGKIGEAFNALQAKAAAPAPADKPAGPQFDKEQYAKLFLDNPLAAAEYLDEVRFGMARPSQAIKATIQDVGALEQSLAVQRFISENDGYEATPENFATLASTMQQYGLKWDYNGMQLAYKAAKADGRLRTTGGEDDAPARQDARFTPAFSRRGAPVVPRGSQVSSSTVDQDLMERYESMTPDQMKAFLGNLPMR